MHFRKTVFLGQINTLRYGDIAYLVEMGTAKSWTRSRELPGCGSQTTPLKATSFVLLIIVLSRIGSLG